MLHVPERGLAGMVCAYALRSKGLDVAVTSKADTTVVSALHTGVWQWGLSPYVQDPTSLSVDGHIEEIQRTCAWHPYAMCSFETLKHVFSQMCALLGDVVGDVAWDKAYGVRAAAEGLCTYDASGGLQGDAALRVGVLQCEDDGSWDAAHHIRSWKTVPLWHRVLWETVCVNMGNGNNPMQMAAMFDVPGTIEACAQQGLEQALGLDVLVVPPYMGVERALFNKAVLQQMWGVRVHEAVSCVWPFAHMRLLQVLMQTWLEQGGVCGDGEGRETVSMPVWRPSSMAHASEGVQVLRGYLAYKDVLDKHGIKP